MLAVVARTAAATDITSEKLTGRVDAAGMDINSLTSAGQPGGAASSGAGNFDLKSEDFINMMLVQLQNLDPTEPASNEELLAQMSQIGQLESSNQLQESLSKLVLQSNLGASGNLIGKTVTGLDNLGDESTGTVTSVSVVDGDVQLELDTGRTISMSKVQAISETDPVTGAEIPAGPTDDEATTTPGLAG